MLRTPPAARVAPQLLTVTLLAAALLVGVGGCGAKNTSWKKGQKPAVGTADTTGMYELVSGKQLVGRYQVFAGEPLGFRKNDMGRVEAVAGMYTLEVNSKKPYAWRMAKKGSDQ